jgi:hypothetical protein
MALSTQPRVAAIKHFSLAGFVEKNNMKCSMIKEKEEEAKEMEEVPTTLDDLRFFIEPWVLIFQSLPLHRCHCSISLHRYFIYSTPDFIDKIASRWFQPS